VHNNDGQKNASYPFTAPGNASLDSKKSSKRQRSKQNVISHRHGIGRLKSTAKNVSDRRFSKTNALKINESL